MRKKGMKISRKIGVGLMLAGFGLLVMSVDPYSMDLIGTGTFLKQCAWSAMLMAGGYSLCRPIEPEGR